MQETKLSFLCYQQAGADQFIPEETFLVAGQCDIPGLLAVCPFHRRLPQIFATPRMISTSTVFPWPLGTRHAVPFATRSHNARNPHQVSNLTALAPGLPGSTGAAPRRAVPRHVVESVGTEREVDAGALGEGHVACRAVIAVAVVDRHSDLPPTGSEKNSGSSATAPVRGGSGVLTADYGA